MNSSTQDQKANLTSKKKLQLAVTPSIKLRENQARLYAFILNKYKSGKSINLKEVVEEYSDYGCRQSIGGEPARYSYDYKEQHFNRVILKGDELRMYAVQWFIRNLGIFVIKGLLTAVPTLELSQLQIESEDL